MTQPVRTRLASLPLSLHSATCDVCVQQQSPIATVSSRGDSSSAVRICLPCAHALSARLDALNDAYMAGIVGSDGKPRLGPHFGSPRRTRGRVLRSELE